MLKIFLVILVFGDAAISVGPLRMSLAECEDRVLPEALQPFEEAWRAGKVLKVEGRVITRADVGARCEIRIKTS